jgi:hypothetical protein
LLPQLFFYLGFACLQPPKHLLIRGKKGKGQQKQLQKHQEQETHGRPAY